MFLKILVLSQIFVWAITACAPQPSISPDTGQAALVAAWQQDQHIVWEIEWLAMPIGGPLTVEIWRAGEQYRFEILESIAPALIGETLIVSEKNAWRYNRFEPASLTNASPPWLAPVSELFTIIDELLSRTPQTATQQLVQVNQAPAQKISLFFSQDENLIFWIDQETHLPVRISFTLGNSEGHLQARSFEPLRDPPDGLFQPIN